MEEHERRADSASRKALIFGAAAAAILAILVIAFVAISRVGIFDAGLHVSIAITLGVGATILLGVGLMALSFYSSRSGVDEAAVSDQESEISDADR